MTFKLGTLTGCFIVACSVLATGELSSAATATNAHAMPAPATTPESKETPATEAKENKATTAEEAKESASQEAKEKRVMHRHRHHHHHHVAAMTAAPNTMATPPKSH